MMVVLIERLGWLDLGSLVIKFVDGCFGEGTVEMTW